MDTQIKFPSTYKTSTVVVSVVFPVLSFVSLLLRYQARHKGRQRLRADDWLIAISWIFALALSIVAWVFVSLTGVNYLKGANPQPSLIKSTQGLWIEALLLQVALTVVKISIMCFYRRIFSTPKATKAADIGIVILSIWGIIYFFVGPIFFFYSEAIANVSIARASSERSDQRIMDGQRP